MADQARVQQSSFDAFRDQMMTENGYHAVLDKGDGTCVIVSRFAFTWGLLHSVIGDHYGYDDRYCYHSVGAAVTAALAWIETGAKEPEGWHRDLRTGRRRPDGDKSREYISL